MSEPLYTTAATSPAFGTALRRLYFIRFAFAVLWAGLFFATSAKPGLFSAILLVVYPLFDAAAVLWQIGADRDSQKQKPSEWINVAVSFLVAIAPGLASTSSDAAVLAVWGIWAVGSGIPQLITAIRNRRSGGQVAQMLSGGISVLAGASFLAKVLRGVNDVSSVSGYAAVGALFFLISAIRLSVLLRKRDS